MHRTKPQIHASSFNNQSTDHQQPIEAATLEGLQNPTGGFGGGFQQLSHCAPTYAAVLALAIVGTEAAYRAIDRCDRKKSVNALRVFKGEGTPHGELTGRQGRG